MFENFIQKLEISFENFVKSMIGSSYKSKWENQNKEIDCMRAANASQISKHKETIENQQQTIKSLSNEKLILELKFSNIKKTYRDYKNKTEKEHLELMIKYQDIISRLKEVNAKKRLLASSKGGLNAKIQRRDKKIKQYEIENKKIKDLLQKVIQESKRKITPATLEELKNYNLYGNRKGRRK